MKWGIRRTPEQLGHKTSSKTKWRIKVSNPLGTKEERYQKKKAKLNEKAEELSRKEELQRQKEDLERRKAALRKPKEKPTDSESRKPTTEIPKHKNVKDMSDDELRQILNRYNMEQQYAKITGGNKQSTKAWVTGMLAKAGQEVASEYTKKAMKAGVEALLKAMKKNNQNDQQNNSGSGSS